MLELEVANENAARHSAKCRKLTDASHTLQQRNRRLVKLLHDLLNDGAVSTEGYRAKIRLELAKE